MKGEAGLVNTGPKLSRKNLGPGRAGSEGTEGGRSGGQYPGEQHAKCQPTPGQPTADQHPEAQHAEDRHPGAPHADGQRQASSGDPAADRQQSADQASPDAPKGDLPDLGKLAQDWITLWQSEMSAMAADREIHESWQTMTALWAGTMASILRALPRGSDPSGKPDGSRRDEANGRSRAADAPRPPSAAAPPDARDAEIERLARHVAALERRLAELERGGNPAVNPASRAGPKGRSGSKQQR